MHCIALRQLKSAMIRLVKGELSMRMDLWYSAMLDTQQEVARHLNLSFKVRLRQKDALGALKQISAILIGISRGKKGLAIHHLKTNLYAAHQAAAGRMKEQLEANLKGYKVTVHSLILTLKYLRLITQSNL